MQRGLFGKPWLTDQPPGCIVQAHRVAASDRKVRQEMSIVFKIILVAFAVFGQTKMFPEKTVSTESSLDSLVLPEEKPELALARRAIESQGLCPSIAADWPELGIAAVPNPITLGNPETPDSTRKKEAKGNGRSDADLATCF